ncbi:Hypothetical predicted protein, partial [Olea europaea subsp. europaea]
CITPRLTPCFESDSSRYTNFELHCLDDGGLSSDEEHNGGEIEIQDTQAKTEDRELKDKLLQRINGFRPEANQQLVYKSKEEALETIRKDAFGRDEQSFWAFLH